MRAIPASPVFDREDARRLGWSDSAVTRAVRSGRLIRLQHGQLCAPSAADDLARIMAATRSCAGSVASHRSALTVHGLPIVGHRPPCPELTMPPRRTGSLRHAWLHRATLRTADVTIVGDVAVTSVARTLIDVGRSRPTSTAVAAIDAALRLGTTTPDALDDVLIASWNWPGIRRAARAVRLSDPRAESPLESVSRLVLRWLGLPTPHLQAIVLGEDGSRLARLDFYWDEFGVAGEADGASKYDARSVLTREKRRQESVEDLGVVFARWGWEDAVHRPHALRRRLEAAYERGSLRDRSGFRRKWSVAAG